MGSSPHKCTMQAVTRDGEIYMILPDVETAESYWGSLSLNGASKHHWEIKPVTVSFPQETATERHDRLTRGVSPKRVRARSR